MNIVLVIVILCALFAFICFKFSVKNRHDHKISGGNPFHYFPVALVNENDKTLLSKMIYVGSSSDNTAFEKLCEGLSKKIEYEGRWDLEFYFGVFEIDYMFIPWVKVGVASSKDDKLYLGSEFESHSSYIPYMGPIGGIGFFATTHILKMCSKYSGNMLDQLIADIGCVFELLRNSESDCHNKLKSELSDITAFGETKAKSLNSEFAKYIYRKFVNKCAYTDSIGEIYAFNPTPLFEGITEIQIDAFSEKIYEILYNCAKSIKNKLQSASNGLIVVSEIGKLNIDSPWENDEIINLPTVYNLIMKNKEFQISYGTQDDSGISVSRILNTAAVKVEEQNPFYNTYYSGSQFPSDNEDSILDEMPWTSQEDDILMEMNRQNIHVPISKFRKTAENHHLLPYRSNDACRKRLVVLRTSSTIYSDSLKPEERTRLKGYFTSFKNRGVDFNPAISCIVDLLFTHPIMSLEHKNINYKSIDGVLKLFRQLKADDELFRKSVEGWQ